MIEFFSETDFILDDKQEYTSWIETVIQTESKTVGDITFVFCDDEYLIEINREFLNHDTYTDIISFDYGIGNQIHGEIYISIERVQENALEFKEPFSKELKRVMIHGILHFLGYKDKTPEEAGLMREKENQALQLFKEN